MPSSSASLDRATCRTDRRRARPVRPRPCPALRRRSSARACGSPTPNTTLRARRGDAHFVQLAAWAASSAASHRQASARTAMAPSATTALRIACLDGVSGEHADRVRRRRQHVAGRRRRRGRRRRQRVCDGSTARAMPSWPDWPRGRHPALSSVALVTIEADRRVLDAALRKLGGSGGGAANGRAGNPPRWRPSARSR